MAAANKYAESDKISLSAFFTINETYLLDTTLHARHALLPGVAEVLRCLKQPITVKDWLGVVNMCGLGAAEAYEILDFLDKHFALEWHPAKNSRMTRHFVALHSPQSIHNLMQHGRSWQAGFYGTASAVCFTIRPIIIVSVIVALLGLFVQVRLADASLAFLIFNAGLWITVTLHEYAHVLVIGKRYGKRVVQRGLRIGILHAPLPAGHDVLTALAGPAIGVAAAIIYVIIGSVLFDNWYVTVLGIALILFQLMSLLPMYGDGRALIKLYREAL